MEEGSSEVVSRTFDQKLLKSGIVIVTGGVDRCGRLIVTLPEEGFDTLYTQYSTAHLVLLIQSYLHLITAKRWRKGLAFLVDLFTANKETVTIIIDALDKIQAEHSGCVGMLYAIMPKTKELCRITKKLLGIKASKKHPKVPLYESTLFMDRTELFRYVMPSQLMSKFSGTFRYNHDTWVIFLKKVDDLKDMIASVINKAPVAQDKVRMLSEYEVPLNSEDINTVLAQVRAKYNDIMRDLNVEPVIDECGVLLQQMSNAESHPAYSYICHTPTFCDAKLALENHRKHLIEVREHLKLLWQQAECRIVGVSKVSKYQEKAEKVLQWIADVGISTVKHDPEIADCLSQAEIFRLHFETGFYGIALDVIGLAEKIERKLSAVTDDVKSKGEKKADTHQLMNYTQQFHDKVANFRQMVEKKHQVYVNVHNFFSNAVKNPDSHNSSIRHDLYTQLHQVVEWYRNALQFLPIQLLQNPCFSGAKHAAASYISDAWTVAVENFLMRHAAPSRLQLSKVKNVIPVIDDVTVRNQARLLIHRVTQLRKLFLTPETLTLAELRDLLNWKDALQHGIDDIYGLLALQPPPAKDAPASSKTTVPAPHSILHATPTNPPKSNVVFDVPPAANDMSESFVHNGKIYSNVNQISLSPIDKDNDLYISTSSNSDEVGQYTSTPRWKNVERFRMTGGMPITGSHGSQLDQLDLQHSRARTPKLRHVEFDENVDGQWNEWGGTPSSQTAKEVKMRPHSTPLVSHMNHNPADESVYGPFFLVSNPSKQAQVDGGDGLAGKYLDNSRTDADNPWSAGGFHGHLDGAFHAGHVGHREQFLHHPADVIAGSHLSSHNMNYSPPPSPESPQGIYKYRFPKDTLEGNGVLLNNGFENGISHGGGPGKSQNLTQSTQTGSSLSSAVQTSSSLSSANNQTASSLSSHSVQSPSPKQYSGTTSLKSKAATSQATGSGHVPQEVSHRSKLKAHSSHVDFNNAKNSHPVNDSRMYTIGKQPSTSGASKSTVKSQQNTHPSKSDKLPTAQKLQQSDVGHKGKKSAARKLNYSGGKDAVQKEHYVSLDHVETPRELPPSLKHVNVDALKENLPQEVRSRKGTAPEVTSSVSLGDSGFAGTHGSASTNGAANSELLGVSVDNEESIVHQILKSTSKDNTDRSHGTNGKMVVIQRNIDAIISSDMSPEEKLNIMAAMCESSQPPSNVPTSQMPVTTSKTVIRDDHTQTTPTPSLQQYLITSRNKLRGHTKPSATHPTSASKETNSSKKSSRASLPGYSKSSETKTSRVQDVPNGQKKTVANSVEDMKADRRRKTTLHEGDYRSKSPQLRNQSSHMLVTDTTLSDTVTIPMNSAMTSMRKIPPDGVHHAMDRRHDDSCADTSTYLDFDNDDMTEVPGINDHGITGMRDPGKHYGIDIEEWIRRQEESSTGTNEMFDLDNVSVHISEQMVRDSVSKLKQARQTRRSEEAELEKAHRELRDLMVAEEEMTQDSVEQSLRRTHRVLQEQEEILLRDRLLAMHDLSPWGNTTESSVFLYETAASQTETIGRTAPSSEIDGSEVESTLHDFSQGTDSIYNAKIAEWQAEDRSINCKMPTRFENKSLDHSFLVDNPKVSQRSLYDQWLGKIANEGQFEMEHEDYSEPPVIIDKKGQVNLKKISSPVTTSQGRVNEHDTGVIEEVVGIPFDKVELQESCPSLSVTPSQPSVVQSQIPDMHHDNASEESGVFTNPSQDSHLKFHQDLLNEPPEGSVTQYEHHSSDESKFPGGQQMISVRQRDFRDVLRKRAEDIKRRTLTYGPVLAEDINSKMDKSMQKQASSKPEEFRPEQMHIKSSDRMTSPSLDVPEQKPLLNSGTVSKNISDAYGRMLLKSKLEKLRKSSSSDVSDAPLKSERLGIGVKVNPQQTSVQDGGKGKLSRNTKLPTTDHEVKSARRESMQRSQSIDIDLSDSSCDLDELVQLNADENADEDCMIGHVNDRRLLKPSESADRESYKTCQSSQDTSRAASLGKSLGRHGEGQVHGSSAVGNRSVMDGNHLENSPHALCVPTADAGSSEVHGDGELVQDTTRNIRHSDDDSTNIAPCGDEDLDTAICRILPTSTVAQTSRILPRPALPSLAGSEEVPKALTLSETLESNESVNFPKLKSSSAVSEDTRVCAGEDFAASETGVVPQQSLDSHCGSEVSICSTRSNSPVVDTAPLLASDNLIVASPTSETEFRLSIGDHDLVESKLSPDLTCDISSHCDVSDVSSGKPLSEESKVCTAGVQSVSLTEDQAIVVPISSPHVTSNVTSFDTPEVPLHKLVMDGLIASTAGVEFPPFVDDQDISMPRSSPYLTSDMSIHLDTSDVQSDNSDDSKSPVVPKVVIDSGTSDGSSSDEMSEDSSDGESVISNSSQAPSGNIFSNKFAIGAQNFQPKQSGNAINSELASAGEANVGDGANIDENQSDVVSESGSLTESSVSESSEESTITETSESDGQSDAVLLAVKGANRNETVNVAKPVIGGGAEPKSPEVKPTSAGDGAMLGRQALEHRMQLMDAFQRRTQSRGASQQSIEEPPPPPPVAESQAMGVQVLERRMEAARAMLLRNQSRQMSSRSEVMVDGSPASQVKVEGSPASQVKVDVHASLGGGTNSFSIPNSFESLNVKTPIVIDNGSGFCKCGFAGEDAPRSVFPAFVGYAKYEEVMTQGGQPVEYVGEAAQSLRGMLKLQYPLSHGIITDWDDMTKIWHHALYDQLRVAPEEHPVLLTEAPENPHRNRERMTQVMFEDFGVPAMYVAVQAVLALYSTGRTTGVVLDIGDGVTHVIPVYEGYSITHAIQRIDLAGRDLTHHLVRLLQQQGITLNSSAEYQIAQEIKEKLCYVSTSFAEDLAQAESSESFDEFYTMPDGEIIAVGTECFRCPEVLFDPSLIGQECSGIHHHLYNSIARCDLDLRSDLLKNIILSGGTTLLPGLPERLHSEISSLCPPGSSAVNIVASPDQHHLVWKGGSILSSLPGFNASWVLRSEYDEFGTSIIHRKCFM